MILSRIFLPLALLVSSVVALSKNYTIADIPKCSLSCLLESLPSSPCSLLDFDCQCNNTPLFLAVAKCSLAKCKLSDSIILSKIQSVQCKRPQESQKGYIRNWLYSLLTITTILTMVRLYSCWVVRGGLFIEDYLVIVSVLFTFALGYLLATMIDDGLGVHVYQIEEATAISRILKYFWTSEALYVVAIAFIKVSLVCSFLRIFPHHNFRLACYSLITGMIILALIWIALLIFQCAPISAGWDVNIVAPKCYRIQTYAYIGAAIAMLQDLAVLVLPIPLLLKLKVNVRRKIAVLAMFSLGIFVLLTSAIRLRSIYHFGTSADPTWDNIGITIWTALEIHVALLCCNLPPIAGLIKHYHRDLFGSSKGGGATTQGAVKRSRTWASGRGVKSALGLTSGVEANSERDLEDLEGSSKSLELGEVVVEREEERKGWNERLKHASVYGATRTVVSTTRVAEYFEERNEEATQEGSSILVTRNVVVRNEAKAGALSGMKTGSQERLCKSKQGL